MNYSTTPIQAPPNAARCLAVITLGSDGPRHSALMSVGVDASSTDRVEMGHTVRTVYWRARVGLTSNALVITPLENPPNPLLDSSPPPPAKQTEQRTPANADQDTSLSGKVSRLLRRSQSPPPAPAPVTDFPAVIEGKPLAGITIPLAHLDSRHLLAVTKGKETPYVQIPVASNDPLKQATLNFQFDDWLAGQAEAEVLAHALERALTGGSSNATANGHPQINSNGHSQVNDNAPSRVDTRSQKAIYSGRDADGSTHPSGDAPYNENWKAAWHRS